MREEQKGPVFQSNAREGLKQIENFRNPHLLEKACTAKAWVEQRRQLQEVPRSSLLRHNHKLDEVDPGAVAAQCIQLEAGLTISMGDVAVVDNGFCKILGCVMLADGSLKLLVDPLAVVAQLGAMSWRCAIGRNW